MTKLQDEIASTFLEKFREVQGATPEMIDGLRVLLSDKKKVKVDDLVKIFARSPGGEMK